MLPAQLPRGRIHTRSQRSEAWCLGRKWRRDSIVAQRGKRVVSDVYLWWYTTRPRLGSECIWSLEFAQIRGYGMFSLRQYGAVKAMISQDNSSLWHLVQVSVLYLSDNRLLPAFPGFYNVTRRQIHSSRRDTGPGALMIQSRVADERRRPASKWSGWSRTLW
jgi:hypothetical protein